MHFFSVLTLILAVGFFILILFYYNYHTKNCCKPKYKGLCIFDIDGTLTTGTENTEVIQKCIDSDYAVGISTAGAMYKPENLLRFKWMPKNLYDFMKKEKFTTFNNVANKIAAGKYDPEGYILEYKKKPFWGWLKGYSLTETAKALDITDYTKIFLFDNDPNYIEKCKEYNNDFNIICSGHPCGNVLSTETLKNLIFY